MSATPSKRYSIDTVDELEKLTRQARCILAAITPRHPEDDKLSDWVVASCIESAMDKLERIGELHETLPKPAGGAQ